MKGYTILYKRKRYDLVDDVVDEMYKDGEGYFHKTTITFSPDLRRAITFGFQQRKS